MTPTQILEDLKLLIPASSSLVQALTKFVTHYDKTTVDGCSKDDDGDMLLFEWGGPYSWNQSCTVSLTRQFSFDNEEGEYTGMQQLRMECNYDPDLADFGGGSEWFEGTDIAEFLHEILSFRVIDMVCTLKMKSLEFELENV